MGQFLSKINGHSLERKENKKLKQALINAFAPVG